MNIVEEKEKLKQRMEEIKNICLNLELEVYVKQLQEITDDIANDFYTMVTIGEFSNGKSTFINALLGQNLLPVGVTPTTATINAIMWGEDKNFYIHHSNGNVEQQELSTQALNDYIASDNFNEQSIEYVKLFLPCPLLENKVVVIDTPGLNDINKLRSKVTYEFIPKADVVFFLLNIRSPIRNTEYKFLTDTLLKLGIDRIIFIANFTDQINEEDADDVLTYMKEQLQKATSMQNIEVYPLSAYDALIGKVENDVSLLELSGINKIEEKMDELLQSGSKELEKYHRYKNRVFHVLSDSIDLINDHILSLQRNESELRKELELINSWNDQQEGRQLSLTSYINDREIEIIMMVRKSVEYLFEQLTEEVLESIQLYHGNDIISHLNNQITILVKRKLKNWIENYSSRIHLLLAKLETEISTGLSKSFHEKVHIKNNTYLDFSHEEELQFKTGKPKDPIVTSGLIVGGVSTLAMILGGPILIPIIGMAGLPFLQKSLLKKQLETIKPQLITEARKQLYKVKLTFSASIEQYVINSIDTIKSETIQQFTIKSQKYEEIVKANLASKQTGLEHEIEKQNQLTRSKKTLSDIYVLLLEERDESHV